MRAIVRAFVAAAVLAAGGQTGAATPKESAMPTAAAPSFASTKEAEDYVATALPAATRANPRYLTKSDGSETEWITKSVSFPLAPTGGMQVAMDESYAQTRGGVATPGTHKASFSLADVDIADFTESGDVTPAGEAARGLLFTCAKPGCVTAEWGGTPSRADKTDVYVQDDATRARIMAAFQFLKALKSPA